MRESVTLAASEQGVAVTPDQLDADPWLLNVKNGTIDLRTGELKPNRRADLITRLAPVTYELDATCPVFEAFLQRVLPDAEVRAFVQRATGYSLTADVSERILLILIGFGRNGKSTYLEALRAALGDYALRMPAESLFAKRDGGHPKRHRPPQGRAVRLGI